jgi:hypothetical protein
MRRVDRPALPSRVQAYLDGRAAAGISNIQNAWKAARQTSALKTVFGALLSMMGSRQRCMYCVDSHGSDIDHFWPKADFPDRCFLWPNMLLCCTECGRFKGSRFPLSATGQPMLIDPSAEDPWEHLDFDPDTGNLTARYDSSSGLPSVKGEATVQILLLDQREGIAEGYRRTYRRIQTCVREALGRGKIVPNALVNEIRQADDHGLVGWCFGAVGARIEPFADLRDREPKAWEACKNAVW